MKVINNISLIYNCTKYRQNNNKYIYAQRSSCVCFKGHDFLDSPEHEIYNKIKASIVSENFLGQGTYAQVYRIKDTDYCVRIPHLANDIYKFYSKELSPADKVNHIVARMGFGVSIMKYFEGIIPKRYMHNSNDRYKLQKDISEMPIKSYSELLYQIANAIDNEMLFDYSPGNLIVDTKNKKLTAIDFYPISENLRQIRPLSEMYSVLTCYGSMEKTGKKIFDNIIDAGLEEFKPNKIPCMDVELFDFIELVRKRNCDNSYRQGSISDNINKFNRLMYSIVENIKKLKQLKKTEITNKTVSGDLEKTIHHFRQLTQKIR